MRITSIGVQKKILQTKFVSRKQHSSLPNFIGLNTLPGVVMSNKSISGKITNRDRARRSNPHLRQGGGSICSTRSRTGHLQQVGNKPWVREGTQLDLPVNARLIRWASLRHNCIKELMSISDQFKLSIKFVIIYLSTKLAPVLEHSLIRSKQY
jgi:hypothetical protein